MFPSSFAYRLLATVVLSVCCSLPVSFAQKSKNKAPDPAPVIKFGVISREEFAKASADSTAEALVLYDFGEVTFEENQGEVWLVFTCHSRTRINKKSAYNRATVQISTRRGRSGQHEYVSEFDGYSYNLANGDVTIDHFPKTAHFSEKVSDDYFREKYTLPNVHEGTIIEYKYTVRTPFSIRYTPRTWMFQQNVPVNWSEYRITIPDYFYYKILQTGYIPMAVNERTVKSVDLYPGQNGASASAYRFAMKDIPAFRDEAYITTEDDYMAKIEFELASYQWVDLRKHDLSVSWADLDRTLLNDADFGGQIKRAPFLRETAKTLLSQHADTLGRVTAAYEFIRKTIKWNEVGGFVSQEDIKKVFENKKGNSAGINLMLVALLREMDLEANPVILSTRSNGRINESYALIRKFNYVVAQVTVGGKDMLLDATDPLLKPGMLPVHCLNGTGRLVHSSASRFVSLLPTEREGNTYTGSFTISDDGEITGTFQQSQVGYSALKARKSFASEGKTKYLEGLQKRRPIWQIEKVDFSGADWNSSSFNTDYTFSIPDACGRAGDRLYLRPMLTEGHGINPFKEPERLYPVDFGYAKEETFVATYTLPQGYQVEEMPKPVSMALPENAGRFTYQIGINTENKLQVVSRIMLRKPMYFAEEYPNLRELFSRIVAKHAEPVILKRGPVAEKK
ncbi:transglutaminase domain-containing protein [Spirosoma panaciterrae]|uniref:transglutaminase domain-containing protein n=1 Tax=Spirosoma panaciterrae TaxID=496058 RepID=UPI000380F90D|nr:transglutaminase domain-containing protein [Spirosoma panaciterrae]